MPHAIEYDRFGGPEVLQFREIPYAVPVRGEVVVEIRAAGVNPLEWKIRSRLRPSGEITAPRRLGADGAGVITALGDGVEGWQVGDEVIVSGASGTYATEVAVPVSGLTRKPAAVTFEQAAAIPVPVGTAYQVLRSMEVGEGTTVLWHGASGAVGQAAVQLARRLDATIVATASEHNHAHLRELGAIPVVYGPGLADRVRVAAPQGIDVAIDGAGTTEAIEVSKELVADLDRIGTIVQGARAAELGIRSWLGGGPNPLTDEEQALRFEGIGIAAELAAKGEFVLEIAHRYPLIDAAEAHRQSETGHVRGKIVLIP